MYKPHIFVSTCPEKHLFREKWLALSLSLFLFFFCFFFLVAPIHGATKHGCAPPVPPPVSGNPVPAPSTQGSVLINEALTQPASTWNCSELAGTFSQQQDSWIELYNPESQPLDLFAARAEISLDDGSTWDYLPFGSAIAPHGFLVIFPEENQADLRSTWTVVLDIANTTVDQASIPQLLPDQSYARVPDGSQNWQSAALPTIDTSNNVSGQSTTPTPSKTPRPTKTPQGSAANSSSGTGTPNDDGTQPAWNGVQLPPNITVIVLTPADPTTPPLSQSQGPPAAQSSEPGSWHGALSILLVVLLLTALVWCWRLFRAP